ncbi:MAG: FAD:protein FMN transferase [Oscillospiraceae bacterium]|jgi:thiamine biosynthesis lipoprotein|nr:FAD:protein FMN transferase [Oscillospiraceae bacterium]
MYMRKKTLLPLIIIVCLLTGCTKTPQPISETRFLLDTVCTITVYRNKDAMALSGALDLCGEYEALFSRTLEGSDIWRINHAGGEPVTVAPQTADVVRLALELGNYSGGMFDITIGRLCALWDFNRNPAVPSEADLNAALKTVDYRQVIVADNTVQLMNPETWLDLGGVAKGYIADQAAAFLKERGVKGAVIDLGGNIVVVGEKPDGSAWRVGVRQPLEHSKEITGALTIGAASVVTSGVYERQFIEDGVMYHHILDPVNGKPAITDVVSATVVTENSAIGDVMSTILILAGSKKAPGLLEHVEGLYGAMLMLDSGELVQYGNIDFDATGY